MLGKKKSHIGRLHGRHAYVRRHVRASSCSCKSWSRGRHLGGRSVCPLCLAWRGLGVCGSQQEEEEPGVPGDLARAAKETGQEVAAWAPLTDRHQQSALIIRKCSFQKLPSG